MFVRILFVFLLSGSLWADDSRPWREPDFSKQSSALGYETGVFAVPEGLKEAVNFWVDIFAKYNSDEGVLHDSENLGCVYERIDLSRIQNNPLLTDRQKHKAEEQLLKNEKDKVAQRLKRIQSTPVTELAAEDLKIVECLKEDPSQDKFLKAAHDDRIRFQQGLKDRKREALFISGRYLEQMEAIFRSHNLPIELTRMVFVESSFNVFARSKVGASGLWQIMPYTARGRIKMSPAIDHRNHPMEATRFAARMLKANYNMLESWPLAITGYNHGPAGIRRIAEKNKTKDIVELIRSNRVTNTFGFASRNFYASFLASLEVERNAEKYFPGLKWAKPLDSLEISLPRSIPYKDLRKWFNGDDRKTQLFNPHISTLARKGRTHLPAKSLIYVPSENYLTALNELKSSKRQPASAQKLALTTYRVEKGDTLSGIASEFRVGLNKLLKANALKRANDIRAGQTLIIPD